MTDQITPLHSNDYPPTAIERELFDAAMVRLDGIESLRQSVLAAELVALGVPTMERAVLIIEAHFAPGGCPPFDDGSDSQRLCWLIRRHSSSLSTPELLALIQKRLPAVTVPEIIAELRRQAEVDAAEADALQREVERRGR